MEDLKPIDEMTTDEKLSEVLWRLREFSAGLAAFSDSPMAKMVPGLTQAFGKQGEMNGKGINV